MSRTGDLLAVALLTLCCRHAWCASPTSLGELSPVERQQADFSGAIAGDGPTVKVTWKLGRPSVELGGDIELTLTVLNAANPDELQRPNLSERPEWKALFSEIRDSPGAIPGEFRYVLKPRAIGEFELPLPKYRFYHPRASEGRRFQVAFAEAPKLAVLPPAPVSVPHERIPIEAPADFFEEPASSGGAPTSPPAAYWWMLLASVALGVPSTIAIWRWRNPDAAKLARIRRAKSARGALDALRKAERAPDSAEAVTRTVLRYLADRWHIPPTARTPSEVAAALIAEARAPEMAAEAESLLALCDRARFAGSERGDSSLPALAARLIERWEGAAE